IVAVRTLPSNLAKKDFLIRMIKSDGDKRGEYWGIPIRNGHNSDWKEAHELHKIFRQRPTDYQESHRLLSEQISNLHELVSNSLETKDTVQSSVDLLPERVKNIIDSYEQE